MAKVFVTTYEVTEAGLPIMEPFLASCQAYRAAGMAVAEQFGASGFRPTRHGPPRTLMFKGSSRADVPEGFKYVQREKDTIECSPLRTTKAGKVAHAALLTIGRRPDGAELAEQFGWSPSQMAMDGSSIYFPTTLSVELPRPRHFLRLPRFEGDGWTQHPALVAIPESEFMRAIEDHNAAAKALKSEPANA